MSSLLHPFTFENIPVRGRLLRLTSLQEHVLCLRKAPENIQRLLAELLTAAAMLVHDAKHAYSINLQVQNVSLQAMAFAHCTPQGHLKAYANEAMESTTFADLSLLPDSHFAVTLDDSNAAQPYQSLVGLANTANAAQALERYFTSSVQTPTYFRVHTYEENGQRHAGAIFLQALPGLIPGEDDWNRLNILLNTLTPQELANPDLSVETLLSRIFAEDTLRLAKPEEFTLQADDPRPRMLAALSNIPPEQLREMLNENGMLTLTDQTSGTEETFTRFDLTHLLGETETPPTKH